QAAAIVGMADRSQAVGDVAEAVVPEAEHAVARLPGHVAGEPGAEIAGELGVGARPVDDAEGLIEGAERNDAAGEIARGEIADLDRSLLNHGQEVDRARASLGHVPDHLDLPARAGSV